MSHEPDPTTRSAGGPDRLSQRNYQRLATFIEGYSGIKMPPTKITMIEGRLRRRLRATGMPDLKQYCDFLFEKDGLATEVHVQRMSAAIGTIR